MKKPMQWLAFALTAMLVGCDSERPLNPSDADQCLRRELFTQCMTVLPKGPESTKYNDWAEVVEECGHQAYYQSMRRIEAIKQECRP